MSHMERRQIWKKRIAAYQASGQSAAEWCAAHQLTTRQLWYWQRKFRDSSSAIAPSSQWVTLSVDNHCDEPKSTLLIKVGSVVIEVAPGYNRTLLSDVVHTLQTLC